MLEAVDFDDPGHMAEWHRRGLTRFAIALTIMLIASIVSSNLSLPVLAVLLGSGLVVTAVFAALARIGIAERRWTLLLWPFGTCSTLSVLHTVSDATAALLFGLIVLAFQFVGITQPRGTGLWFLLPAAFLLVQLTELSTKDSLVRLPIAILVWIVVSEVPARLLGQLRDKQRALERLATTDALTGLLNRSRLEAHLEIAEESSAVALIDVDHFKGFNDTHGHIEGDLALKAFADVLRVNTRPFDAVFRYGGEEFLVILPHTTTVEAAAILDRCAEAWGQREAGLTFSAGITEGGVDAVRTADGLLYQAKRNGRARVLTAERAVAV